AGIDSIPSTPLPRAEGIARPTATSLQMIERAVRRTAAARGLSEAVTWSFVSEAEAAAVGGGEWTLAIPVAVALTLVRPALLPGLPTAPRRSPVRGASSAPLVEVGRCYPEAGARLPLSLVLAGIRAARAWRTGKARTFAAYEAK